MKAMVRVLYGVLLAACTATEVLPGQHRRLTNRPPVAVSPRDFIVDDSDTANEPTGGNHPAVSGGAYIGDLNQNASENGIGHITNPTDEADNIAGYGGDDIIFGGLQAGQDMTALNHRGDYTLGLDVERIYGGGGDDIIWADTRPDSFGVPSNSDDGLRVTQNGLFYDADVNGGNAPENDLTSNGVGPDGIHNVIWGDQPYGRYYRLYDTANIADNAGQDVADARGAVIEVSVPVANLFTDFSGGTAVSGTPASDDVVFFTDTNGRMRTGVVSETINADADALIRVQGSFRLNDGRADGDDTIYGGVGRDIIFGGGGHDKILGNAGFDTIYGDAVTYMLDMSAGPATGVAGDMSNPSLVTIWDENYTLPTVNDFPISHPRINTNGPWAGGSMTDGVDGRQGEDLLYGGLGDDLILAGPGPDRVWGGDGYDTILPGPGDDLVWGGDGNDQVISRAFLMGAQKVPLADTQQAAGAFAAATLAAPVAVTLTNGQSRNAIGIDDTDPSNVMVLLDNVGVFDHTRFSLGDDVIRGGGGRDIIEDIYGENRLYGGSGNDVIYGAALTTTNLDGAAPGALYTDDQMVWGEGGQDTIVTGDGDDSVWGGSGGVYVVKTNGGDDMVDLSGAGGAITTSATSGEMHATLGDGADTFIGHDGADTAQGGDGDDTISGGSGFDALYGEGGNDLIYGGQGKDYIAGGAGNDRIHVGDNMGMGMGSDDEVSGGDGVDWIYARSWQADAAGDQDHTIYGGAGADRIYANGVWDLANQAATPAAAPGASPVFLGFDPTGVTIDGGAGCDTINGRLAPEDHLVGSCSAYRQFRGAQAGPFAALGGVHTSDRVRRSCWSRGYSPTSDEAMWCARYRDMTSCAAATVRGGCEWRGHIIPATDGDDEIFGNSPDTIFAYEGDDVIFVTDIDRDADGFATTSVATIKNDIMTSNDYSNVVNQGDRIGATVSGSVGEDFIVGGLGDDTLMGGQGSDKIYGWGGDDTIYARGEATVVVGTPSDYLNGGAGDDTIYGSDNQHFETGGAGVCIRNPILFDTSCNEADLNNSGATRTEIADTNGIQGHANCECKSSTSGIPNPTSPMDCLMAWDDVANAQNQRRCRWWTPSRGAITSGASLYVDGGHGDDSIFSGQQSTQRVDGGGGDDLIISTTGQSDITGSDGDDIILNLGGNGYHDTIHGNDGDDLIMVNQGLTDGGSQTIYGDAGDDRIYGADTNDYIRGNEGDDRLFGYTGQDFIYGNAGDDYIRIESGSGSLVGGSGDDTIVVANDITSGRLTVVGEEATTVFGESGDDTIYTADDNTGEYTHITPGAGWDVIYADNNNNNDITDDEDVVIDAGTIYRTCPVADLTDSGGSALVGSPSIGLKVKCTTLTGTGAAAAIGEIYKIRSGRAWVAYSGDETAIGEDTGATFANWDGCDMLNGFLMLQDRPVGWDQMPNAYEDHPCESLSTTNFVLTQSVFGAVADDGMFATEECGTLFDITENCVKWGEYVVGKPNSNNQHLVTFNERPAGIVVVSSDLYEPEDIVEVTDIRIDTSGGYCDNAGYCGRDGLREPYRRTLSLHKELLLDASQDNTITVVRLVDATQANDDAVTNLVDQVPLGADGAFTGDRTAIGAWVRTRGSSVLVDYSVGGLCPTCLATADQPSGSTGTVTITKQTVTSPTPVHNPGTVLPAAASAPSPTGDYTDELAAQLIASTSTWDIEIGWPYTGVCDDPNGTFGGVTGDGQDSKGISCTEVYSAEYLLNSDGTNPWMSGARCVVGTAAAQIEAAKCEQMSTATGGTLTPHSAWTNCSAAQGGVDRFEDQPEWNCEGKQLTINDGHQGTCERYDFAPGSQRMMNTCAPTGATVTAGTPVVDVCGGLVYNDQTGVLEGPTANQSCDERASCLAQAGVCGDPAAGAPTLPTRSDGTDYVCSDWDQRSTCLNYSCQWFSANAYTAESERYDLDNMFHKTNCEAAGNTWYPAIPQASEQFGQAGANFAVGDSVMVMDPTPNGHPNPSDNTGAGTATASSDGGMTQARSGMIVKVMDNKYTVVFVTDKSVDDKIWLRTQDMSMTKFYEYNVDVLPTDFTSMMPAQALEASATIYQLEVQVFPNEGSCETSPGGGGANWGTWIGYMDNNGQEWNLGAGSIGAGAIDCSPGATGGVCPNMSRRSGYQPTDESQCLEYGGRWRDEEAGGPANAAVNTSISLHTTCTAVYCPRGVSVDDMDRCFDGRKQDCVVCEYALGNSATDACARRRMLFMGGDIETHRRHLAELDNIIRWKLPAPVPEKNMNVLA